MVVKNIAIVAGSFHKEEIALMLAATQDAIQERGGKVHSVVWVPGAYEMPLAAKRLLLNDDVIGVVVLGVIERGETAHGRVMGQSVSDALIRLQLDFMKPIGIGIIGPEADPCHFPPRLAPHARAAAEAALLML